MLTLPTRWHSLFKGTLLTVHANQPATLFPFVGNPRHNMPVGLQFRLQDYLKLLDWTGRQLCPGKRGAIESTLPPILERLNIDPKNWHLTWQSRFY